MLLNKKSEAVEVTKIYLFHKNIMAIPFYLYHMKPYNELCCLLLITFCIIVFNFKEQFTQKWKFAENVLTLKPL